MKILVAIANFGYAHEAELRAILQTYQSMSFDVDIVVHSDCAKDCGSDVEVIVGLPTENPYSLTFTHKSLFAERHHVYDLFLYTEDDILIPEHAIMSFLHVTRVLPSTILAGLFRYEIDGKGRWHFVDANTHYHWESGSCRTIGPYLFGSFTNEHAGCYLLTQEQLKVALASGGYLRPPTEGKYEMRETAATDPYTNCGLRKVLCLSHLHDFLVHHMPNTYVGKLGTEESVFSAQLRRFLQKEGYDPDRYVSAIPRKTSFSLSAV